MKGPMEIIQKLINIKHTENNACGKWLLKCLYTYMCYI